MSYTKGPWILTHEETACQGVNRRFCIDSDTRLGIASGQSQEHLGTSAILEEEMMANAKLIAAAPDLLAALIEMEREKSDYMTRNNLGDPSKEHTNKMARAAIAKAQS